MEGLFERGMKKGGEEEMVKIDFFETSEAYFADTLNV